MDLIERQAAIDELENRKDKNAKGDIGRFYNQIIQQDIDHLKELPSAEPESCDMCDFCDGLESGDKLFQMSDWDGGIGFDYIYIKYCPMCGRRL